MKIKLQSTGRGERWIDDNSLEAQKILEGYNFEFDEKNKTVIGMDKVAEISNIAKMTNIYQAKIVLGKITTLADFKKVISKILDLL